MDNPNIDNPTGTTTNTNEQLDPEVADVLTRIYWQRRVEYQLEYYQDRAREYEQHVDVAFRLGAILMTISSLLASLGVVMSNDEIIAPLISLLTAIIPAVVSYVAAFRQLYQWDRQITLYRDTQLNLETAKLAVPDLNDLKLSEAPSHFPQLVKAVESVLQQEIAQWGQIARGQVDDDDDVATEDFEASIKTFLTDNEGNLDEEQVAALRSIYEASKSEPYAGQYALGSDEEARQRRERATELARAASTSTDSTSSESQPVLPAPEDTTDAELNIEDEYGTVQLNLEDDSSEQSGSDTESDPEI